VLLLFFKQIHRQATMLHNSGLSHLYSAIIMLQTS